MARSSGSEKLNPYQSPGDASGVETASVGTSSSWLWLFFSFSGRIGRSAFWLALVLLLICSSVSVGIASAMFDLERLNLGTADRVRLERWLQLGGLLPFVWSWCAISVKRWHDRNKGAAWIFINAVPYVGGIWAFVECGLMAGTRGANRYGKRSLAPWSE